MHLSFSAHQGFQCTSMGSHLSRVSCTTLKHYSSPLLQIQTHRLSALPGRESGFNPYHSHSVFPSYFSPLFSKPALIVPSIKPYTNRLSSLSRNLIPRDGTSRSNSVYVDICLFH